MERKGRLERLCEGDSFDKVIFFGDFGSEKNNNNTFVLFFILCFCSFHFMLKSLFLEQMYWFCSSSTNVLLTDIFLAQMFCCEAKEVFSFLFFEVRMAAKRCSARVSPSHLSHLSNGETSETKNKKTRERDMRKIGKQRHQMEGAKGNTSATNINTHIEWTHPQRHQRKSRKNMKKKQNFVFFCFPKFRCYHPKNPSLIKRNMNKKME